MDDCEQNTRAFIDPSALNLSGSTSEVLLPLDQARRKGPLEEWEEKRRRDVEGRSKGAPRRLHSAYGHACITPQTSEDLAVTSQVPPVDPHDARVAIPELTAQRYVHIFQRWEDITVRSEDPRRGRGKIHQFHLVKARVDPGLWHTRIHLCY